MNYQELEQLKETREYKAAEALADAVNSMYGLESEKVCDGYDSSASHSTAGSNENLRRYDSCDGKR